jgi:hypothetical protein
MTAANADAIEDYNRSLSVADQEIFEALESTIRRCLPEADGKVWHGSPVWFLDGNPVVGYHRLKDGIRVLFWSGQSFPDGGLSANGTFKAADFRVPSLDVLDTANFERLLAHARAIQWDYGNLQKLRKLVKKTDF